MDYTSKVKACYPKPTNKGTPHERRAPRAGDTAPIACPLALPGMVLGDSRTHPVADESSDNTEESSRTRIGIGSRTSAEHTFGTGYHQLEIGLQPVDRMSA